MPYPQKTNTTNWTKCIHVRSKYIGTRASAAYHQFAENWVGRWVFVMCSDVCCAGYKKASGHVRCTTRNMSSTKLNDFSVYLLFCVKYFVQICRISTGVNYQCKLFLAPTPLVYILPAGKVSAYQKSRQAQLQTSRPPSAPRERNGRPDRELLEGPVERRI